jgi:hypothetical protein
VREQCLGKPPQMLPQLITQYVRCVCQFGAKLGGRQAKFLSAT